MNVTAGIQITEIKDKDAEKHVGWRVGWLNKNFKRNPGKETSSILSTIQFSGYRALDTTHTPRPGTFHYSDYIRASYNSTGYEQSPT